MTERWLPVVGFEGMYEVSNLGRVRSLDRVVTCSGPAKGTYPSLKKGRMLRPGSMTAGHQSVALGRDGGSRCVHELVLTAFVGPRPAGTEARHLDGDEKNNRLSNLKWDTRANNNRDKKWHKGCRQYKLKPDQIAFIKQNRHRHAAYLAGLFNVSVSLIYYIRQGKLHIDV